MAEKNIVCFKLFSKQDKIDLLPLRRQTKLSRLFGQIPRPRGAVPLNGPEEWHSLLLDQKIPMFNFPAGSNIVFTRNKLSRSIFGKNKTEFDLSDPYCREGSFEYQPLHDPTLRHMFCRAKYIKMFRKKKLITVFDDVICTLKQFNEFRKYLKRVHIIPVNKLRIEHEEDVADAIKFKAAEKKIFQLRRACERDEKVAETRRRYYEGFPDLVMLKKALLAKYKEALKRNDRANRAKQYRLKAWNTSNRQRVAARRATLSLMEKKRIILLRRKFTVEELLVRQNLNLLLAKKKNAQNQRLYDQWQGQVEFRFNRRVRHEHLLALDEELHSYEIMRRNKFIQESYARDLHQTTLKRCALLQKRYPGRACDDLVRVMQTEIAKFVKRQQKQDLINAQKESEQSDGKRTIPYEPKHLTSVGLLDTTQGYAKLTKADIKAAVEASYQQTVDLKEQISAQEILQNANDMLRLVYKGYNLEMPRDQAVVECVQKRVALMLHVVQLKPVDYVKALLLARGSPKVKKDTCNCCNVRFGETYPINTSAYSEFIQNVRPVDRSSNCRTISVPRIVRTIINSPDETVDDPRIMQPDMKDKSIAHLYKFQKQIIFENLDRFEQKLDAKVREKISKYFCFETLKLKCVLPTRMYLDAVQLALITDQATESVLTLPINDAAFGKLVWRITNKILFPILRLVDNFIQESNPNQEVCE